MISYYFNIFSPISFLANVIVTPLLFCANVLTGWLFDMSGPKTALAASTAIVAVVNPRNRRIWVPQLRPSHYCGCRVLPSGARTMPQPASGPIRQRIGGAAPRAFNKLGVAGPNYALPVVSSENYRLSTRPWKKFAMAERSSPLVEVTDLRSCTAQGPIAGISP